MKALNLQTILEIISGTVLKGDANLIIRRAVKSFGYIRSNNLYLDINRVKSFDSGLLERYQAVAVVTDEPDKFIGMKGSFTLIQVRDMTEAYWKFVSYYRSLFTIPIVAVTGTCGKTTTCEMIKHLLGKKYTLTTTATAFEIHETLNSYLCNLNYLSNMDEKTQVALFEAAVGKPGDLSDTCRHFKPQIRVLLNIGVYHLVGCKTLEAYIRAKAELLEGMDPVRDLLIVNTDDENIKKIDISKVERVLYFGMDKKADFQIENIHCSVEGIHYTFSFRGRSYHGYLNSIGRHDVYNALAAIAVVKAIGMDIEEACEGLKTFEPVYKHLELRTLPGGCQIIDDSWNNNPPSMAAALSTLKEIAAGRRKVAVLGAMHNLGSGKSALEQYEEMGRKVMDAGVDVLITIGSMPQEIGRTAIRLGMDARRVFNAMDQKELDQFISPYLEKGTIILFKSYNQNVAL